MSALEASPLLELRLLADPEAVPLARHQAMRACNEVGLAEEDCFTLDLALGEALANAVVHGAPLSSGEQHVLLSLWSYQDRLIIRVRDHGPGFRPPPPPYRMPEAAWEETHGRGLPLMETLTDAMIVCRESPDQGGASVYLIKKISR